MSGYGDIKTSKFKNALTRLANKKGIFLKQGAKHQIRVECIYNSNAYPIPSNHPTINKYIVGSFQKWLEKNDVCTKEEFDNYIR
jgi:hypothetical protein